MRTCADMLERLEKVDILLSMQIALEETASEAVKQQKLQLQQGLRSDDTTLPDYSFRSVFQYGKPPGPIRLYDQGDFYQGFLFDVRPGYYVLTSADQKTEMLKNRYGADIEGLGSDATNNYIVVVRPAMINEVTSYLK